PVVEVTDETIPPVAEESPKQTEDTEREPKENFEAVRPAEQNASEQTQKNEGTDGNRNQKDNRHEGGREQGLNLFAQNLKAEQYEPQVQQADRTESAWDTDTQNIMRQIMDYMKVNLKADMSTMEMQLHPASLGTLQVQIASKGGVVTANFITQNEAVKAALESQMVQLQERFEEQGVKVEAIEVTVQTHQFEQNLEQGRRGGGQEQESAKKGRVRRINLNDSLLPEDMEEEDALAKDIMIANGNTVDYTA
ncbi:MAG: flagellar hook-length control protein FliK, partial [Acetatifactor sp.]|nr:flagellar hook-length control protein FliK [Acetatifactor sp.]